MLYLFFNLLAWGFGDQSSSATWNKVLARALVFVGVSGDGEGVLGWVFSCNSGTTFFNSKRKRYKLYSCFFLFSLWTNDREWMFFRLLDSSIVCTSMDWARPCVTLEGFAFGWFRVIVPCPVETCKAQHTWTPFYTLKLYRLCGPLGPRQEKYCPRKGLNLKTSNPPIALAPKLPKQSRSLVVFTWSNILIKETGDNLIYCGSLRSTPSLLLHQGRIHI